jgi:hypothetical protein
MCRDLALALASLISFAERHTDTLREAFIYFFFILPEPLALWVLAFRLRFRLCFRHAVLASCLLGVSFLPEHLRLRFRNFL